MADADTTAHPTLDEMKKAGGIAESVPAPELKQDEDDTVHPTAAEMDNTGALPKSSPSEPAMQHASMEAEKPKSYRTRATRA